MNLSSSSHQATFRLVPQCSQSEEPTTPQGSTAGNVLTSRARLTYDVARPKLLSVKWIHRAVDRRGRSAKESFHKILRAAHNEILAAPFRAFIQHVVAT